MKENAYLYTAAEEKLNEIARAVASIRFATARREVDVCRLIAESLRDAGIAAQTELRLAPRCRVDFWCPLLPGEDGMDAASQHDCDPTESLTQLGVAIEVKKGTPPRAQLLAQLERYLRCEAVCAVLVIVEGRVQLPDQVVGKPCRAISLHRLWGVSLP